MGCTRLNVTQSAGCARVARGRNGPGRACFCRRSSPACASSYALGKHKCWHHVLGTFVLQRRGTCLSYLRSFVRPLVRPCFPLTGRVCWPCTAGACVDSAHDGRAVLDLCTLWASERCSLYSFENIIQNVQTRVAKLFPTAGAANLSKCRLISKDAVSLSLERRRERQEENGSEGKRKRERSTSGWHPPPKARPMNRVAVEHPRPRVFAMTFFNLMHVVISLYTQNA